MLKPKHLKKGDTFGIVSPASPSENKSDVVRCVEWLEKNGYKSVVGKNVNKTKGFTAASEEDRAADINEMFSRDDVDVVISTQGGYGSAQLMKYIDFNMITKNPKIFVGFSDITSLHLMLNKFSNIVTFHGPGIARFNSEELTPYTETQFFKAISDLEALGNIPLADEKKWLNCINKGKAKGQIIGGNLTLLCSSLGTPYEFDCKDKLLFIEDTETEPWIFDHMLSHLRNSGKLNDAAGIIFGECENCVPFKHNPGYYCDTSLEDVINYYAKPLGIPVMYGLPLGHTKDLATIPIGVEGFIDSDAKRFEILESGVI
ncbi:MAG: LD-carboxypeptidase [Peptostreptococcaceae bacterium]|nr:LD-carboxypeptidase [Peptostreptococcaceae bacterium]